MGVVLKDILAVLPNGNEPEVKKTSIYIEGDNNTEVLTAFSTIGGYVNEFITGWYN